MCTTVFLRVEVAYRGETKIEEYFKELDSNKRLANIFTSIHPAGTEIVHFWNRLIDKFGRKTENTRTFRHVSVKP